MKSLTKPIKDENKAGKGKWLTCYLVIAAFILSSFLLLHCGCSQPGETTAEGHIRHRRNVKINQQELMQDIDRALLMDQPSKLSDKRVH